MTRQHTLISLLLLTSAMLAACSDKAKDAPEAAPVENGVAQGEEASAPADGPQLPQVDYWAPLAPYVKGDYSGQCMQIADGPSKKSISVTVAADGSYKVDEYSGNMRKSDLVSVNRSRAEDGSMGLMFSVMERDAAFSLVAGDKGQGRTLNFGKGPGNMLSCEAPQETLALLAKPLHVIYASELAKATVSIGCLAPGSLTPTMMDYAFKDGVLSIGKFKHALADMDEVVMIKGESTSLHYTATGKDKSSVTVVLNEFGKLEIAMRNVGGESMMMCTVKD